MRFLDTPPACEDGGASIQRNVHLPENIVKLIKRVIFDIDLATSIATMPEFYAGTEMRR